MGCQKRRKTYLGEGCDAEAGAAVEPVIISKFINLDALLVRGLMRHRLCHHRRLGVALRDDDTIVPYQARGDIEMLLQGEFGRGLVMTQEGERRSHGSFLCAPGEGTQRRAGVDGSRACRREWKRWKRSRCCGAITTRGGARWPVTYESIRALQCAMQVARLSTSSQIGQGQGCQQEPVGPAQTRRDVAAPGGPRVTVVSDGIGETSGGGMR